MTSSAVRSVALASFFLIAAAAVMLLAACSPVTLLNALAPRDSASRTVRATISCASRNATPLRTR